MTSSPRQALSPIPYPLSLSLPPDRAGHRRIPRRARRLEQTEPVPSRLSDRRPWRHHNRRGALEGVGVLEEPRDVAREQRRVRGGGDVRAPRPHDPAGPSGLFELRRWPSARTCGMSADAASAISCSAATRSTARAISASYEPAGVAPTSAAPTWSMTSPSPGSDGSTACCSTRRAARSGLEDVREGVRRRDDGRRDDVEGHARVAWEQLARHVVAVRPRRHALHDGVRQRERGRLDRLQQRAQRRLLLGGRRPANGSRPSPRMA